MPQVKIYGLTDTLNPIKATLSDVIHGCMQEALGLPENKRFHRFIALNPDDFYYPGDRTEQYLIIEISMFEGRSVETKKQLLRLLMQRIHTALDIPVNDIEITIFETPNHQWGIRGMTGDELGLTYKVTV
ncbi:MAG: tautomerase family protein [Cyanobacteria bacterium P01_E01_bin.6]